MFYSTQQRLTAPKALKPYTQSGQTPQDPSLRTAPRPVVTGLWTCLAVAGMSVLLQLSAFGQNASGSTVTLAWDPSPDANIAGYNIYYGVASQAYNKMLSAGKGTSASVTGLVPGTTYYFAATAVDTAGLESDYSNEVSYQVPNGQPRVTVQVSSSGSLILRANGQSGHSYSVLATQDFRTWTPVGIAVAGSDGTFQFTDPAATSSASRFYRLQAAP